jgi:subtilisin-like proprotein convertase family protein
MLALAMSGCGGGGATPDGGDLTVTVDRYIPPDIIFPDRPGVDAFPEPDLPPLDPTAEQEPNDDPNTATPLTIGTEMKGTIGTVGDLDTWSFRASAGQLLRITLNPGPGFSATADSGLSAASFVMLRVDPANNTINYYRVAVQTAAGAVTRQIYSTKNTTYFIWVGTIQNQQLFNGAGTMANQRGGPMYTYTLKVDEEAAPTPIAGGPLPATGLSDPLTQGDLQFYTVQAATGFLAARFEPVPALTNFLPIISIWDPTAMAEVATSELINQSTLASTLAPVMTAGERWVIVDSFFPTGTPTYALDIQTVAPAPNDTCTNALDVATNGDEVTPGDPTAKLFTGWTAGKNDVALASQNAPTMCIATPVVNAMPQPITENGPDLFYSVVVPAGNRLAARLDSEFNGALYFATDCADVPGTCVAGSDIDLASESASYVNSGTTDQTVKIAVSTTDPFGGMFSLLVNTAAQCFLDPDCEATTQLGNYCQDFKCVDPSNGAAMPIPASINDTGLPIPDGANAQGMPCMPGKPVTTTFTSTVTGNVTKLHVYVDAKHTFRGDLKIELLHPDQTTVVLKAVNEQDNAANVITVYPDQTAASGDLATLNGKPASGTWTLRLSDACAPDSGTLNKAALFIEAQ